MILYLDTSALVKLYINESLSNVVHKAVAKADAVATHHLAFVESHSSFARLLREKAIGEEDYEMLKKKFQKEWGSYLKVGFGNNLLQKASEYIEAFALRAYDSVHLAAAHNIYSQEQQDLVFACFDKKLNQAAKILNFELLQSI